MSAVKSVSNWIWRNLLSFAVIVVILMMASIFGPYLQREYESHQRFRSTAPALHEVGRSMKRYAKEQERAAQRRGSGLARQSELANRSRIKAIDAELDDRSHRVRSKTARTASFLAGDLYDRGTSRSIDGHLRDGQALYKAEIAAIDHCRNVHLEDVSL